MLVQKVQAHKAYPHKITYYIQVMKENDPRWKRML